MTDCRIYTWYQKTSKARKSAPELKTLPPTQECFAENVKRGVLQTMICYDALQSKPPEVDPTCYGWKKDLPNKILLPVGIPEGILPAPESILKMVKCGCSSNTPCSSRRCSCSSSKMPCSVICKCRGDPDLCFNKETKDVTSAEAICEELTNEEEAVSEDDSD